MIEFVRQLEDRDRIIKELQSRLHKADAHIKATVSRALELSNYAQTLREEIGNLDSLLKSERSRLDRALDLLAVVAYGAGHVADKEHWSKCWDLIVECDGNDDRCKKPPVVEIHGEKSDG